MKPITTILTLALILCFASLTVNSQDQPLSNKDIIAMSAAGLDKTLIISKIKASKTDFDISPQALIELKKAGVSDEVIAFMITPSSVSSETQKPKKVRDELGTLFGVWKNSVVTVWSEFGHGSGFIVTDNGLIVTNFHVVGPTRFVAVQFDEKLKVEAKIVASDPEKDIAILWADTSQFPNAITARLIDLATNSVEEGERVMAIGSPLNQTKIMTTGVVSKVEERAIISDVNVNHGNSGGPLFNSLGEVIGIITFGDFTNRGGPGISGIIRIEQAIPVLQDAIQKLPAMDPAPSTLLPVEPEGDFPIDAIKTVATAKKFNFDPYVMEVGKFTVTFFTPSVKYRLATEYEREALKGRKDREKNSQIKGTFNAFQDFYGWREYVGDYKPVLQIRATPELAETGGSLFGRMLLAGMAGVRVPAKLRFKADFYKMRLFCGDREVAPIQPSKIARILNETGYFVSIKDATYEGFYTYPADAVNEDCGQVRIEIKSEQKPDEPQIRTLKAKELIQIINDFKPYFDSRKSIQN